MPMARAYRSRSTTGCIGCRLRRKKCSEEKPHCHNCLRNEILCTYPRPGNAKHHEMLRRTNPTGRRHDAGTLETPSACSATVLSPSPESHAAAMAADDAAILRVLRSIPVSPSLLAHALLRQPTSRRFFHHYVHHTYRAMAICQGTRNPFLWELVPMAMGSDLVLSAVLTFSGLHYAAKAGVPAEATTWVHYGQTIRGIKYGLTQLAQGNKASLVPLLVTAILLSILETFRAGAGSYALQHLKAARALLQKALQLPESQLSRTTRAFLVERYTYTMVLAHLTMGQDADQWVLDDTALLFPMLFPRPGGDEYMRDGVLCTPPPRPTTSCVHELFYLIPRVSVLAHQWAAAQQMDLWPRRRLAAEHAQLKAALTRWQPSSDDEAHIVCGRLYQQALLVYLASACEEAGEDEAISRADVQHAFEVFLPLLASIPLDSSSSTTLCWPLVVFGACARQPAHRRAIAAKLDSLSAAYAAQSVRDAKELLERLWQENDPESTNLIQLEAMMKRAQTTVLFL